MKINIYKKVENLPIDTVNLKLLKTEYENLSTEIDSIIFDTDSESLKRLDILSVKTNTVYNFKDFNNEVVLLSGNQIGDYYIKIKEKLADRYAAINEIYYNLREDFNLTYTQAVSVFESLDI